MVTFDTDRLTLRMLRETDFDAYAEMCADHALHRRWPAADSALGVAEVGADDRSLALRGYGL